MPASERSIDGGIQRNALAERKEKKRMTKSELNKYRNVLETRAADWRRDSCKMDSSRNGENFMHCWLANDCLASKKGELCQQPKRLVHTSRPATSGMSDTGR